MCLNLQLLFFLKIKIKQYNVLIENTILKKCIFTYLIEMNLRGKYNVLTLVAGVAGRANAASAGGRGVGGVVLLLRRTPRHYRPARRANRRRRGNSTPRTPRGSCNLQMQTRAKITTFS